MIYNQMSRIVLLIPLVWVIAHGAFADVQHRQKKQSLVNEHFELPVAKLGTPQKNIEIFRLTAAERTEWTYMVVTSDEDGTRRSYGDDQTVGRLIASLSHDFRASASAGSRCPASSGWLFESADVHANYCSETLEAQRIERAAELLATTPSLE